MARPRKKTASVSPAASNYQHTEATQLLRPEVGTQPLFKKKKEPATYRYDSSLSPALDWDNNPAREQGEALLRQMHDAKTLDEAKAAAAQLAALSRPFLNWTGKAERLSFDVPTLPLFVHERLSTRAILETLKSHKRDKQQDFITELFGNPSLPVTDQVLRAYEHREQWQNRMVLGDSLVVMNSLLRFENLGGQVQMIYLDPPYGVKFGSNFQPFVRKRGVTHGEDADLTREPEMVQAYRDTWELGLHSYLTYLRDRFLLARDLLHPSGSIFVQISDENLHHVRELMDEVFGAENFKGLISFSKTTGMQSSDRLSSQLDYLLWFGRDGEQTKYNPLFERKDPIEAGFNNLELSDGTRRPLSREERKGTVSLPPGARLFMLDNLTKPGPGAKYDFTFENVVYTSGKRWWGTPKESLERLVPLRRVAPSGRTLRYVRYFDDFPFSRLTNLWQGFGGAADPIYVVQTNTDIVERCLLITTDPGDLVIDPTCGSGTTAYVAEQWGRRWITIDTSRVPLALARQRLLTATFDYYELNDDKRGPASGFVYLPEGQSRNAKRIGPGIIPHVMLENIANNEPPKEEVLVDRPEIKSGIVRVTGPFSVEASIPTPVDWEGDGPEDSGAHTTEEYGNFVSRMIEILRRNPVLHLDGNQIVTLRQVRPPARTLSLHAEALVKEPTLESLAEETEAQKKLISADEKPVAFVFGPEHGAVSHKLVENAAIEARRKDYTHLYVIGFAIEAGARKAVEESEAAFGIHADYVQATPDILMGDLLKTMRSSQIFSVCGLPEIKVLRKITKAPRDEELYEVELLGLDVFDPVEMKSDHRSGMDVPAWLLDTDYNGTVFRVCQAFFPRTGAWENLKRELRAEFEESVWAHLAGTTSAPFHAGPNKTVAVKVIDDRGNELLVTKAL